jgi:hypothetical protein
MTSLRDALCDAGLVTDPEVLEAIGAEPREKHHPPEYAPLTRADIPVPTSPRMGTARPSPSPTVTGLLLQMAELEPGLRVAVADGDPYTMALASRLVGGRVAGEELLFGAAVQAPYDRVVLTVDGILDTVKARGFVADGGFALIPRYGKPGPEVVKVLCHGGEFLEMRITQLGAAAAGLHQPDLSLRSPFAVALTVDRHMQNLWCEVNESPRDTHFAETVAGTFEPRRVAAERLAGPALARWEIARKAFGCAHVLQSAGSLEAAAEAYAASLAVFPTAEAHTFLGWTRSFQGRLEEAIQECQRAIETDPSFGNPYNDIGAYLLDLGKPEEALPWLEKAKKSRRYQSYYFAHTNLARAYLMLRMPQNARRELESSVAKYPEYEPAREMLRQMDRRQDYMR